MRTTPFSALLSAVLLAPAGLSQNLLTNPDFESGLTGWSTFGNASSEFLNPPGVVPLSGVQVAKMYGNFTGSFNVTGIFQSFPASPGQTFTLDCFGRHWDGDRLLGAGLPNDNAVVMKIAFWDSLGGEVGGGERLVIDGLSPQNTWVNPAPVAATAPVNTVRVEALILFLQPNVDAGSAQIDDVTFTGPPPTPTYPGTGEDLVLSTGLGGSPLASGAGNDVRQAPATPTVLELNISSPGGTYDLQPYLVLAQLFGTGAPPVPAPVFPELWFDFVGGSPLLVLQTGTPSPIGPALIGPNGGTSHFYMTPVGFTGVSFMVQAIVLDPGSANAFYAASDAFELQLQ